MRWTRNNGTLSQGCTTQGPRAACGPQKAMMRPAKTRRKCVYFYVNDNQAYLITALFLHKHSYEHKNFAVVSGNRYQLQGDFVSLTRGFVPGPHWGHSPQTPLRPPLSFQNYFWHYLWNRLCTPDIVCLDLPKPLTLFWFCFATEGINLQLSLIHISEPTRPY